MINKYVTIGVLLIIACCYSRQIKAQSILDNTQVRFFGNAGFSASRDSAKRYSHAFEIGDVEMLITSQVTDRISVLAEAIYTADNGLELDRVMIKYNVNDYFNIGAGKLYAPIGIWNTTFYHQARVLTPTIDHPVIIADQSDFGVLNNKDIGVQLSGENISKIRLGYKLMVGNGYTNQNTNRKSLTYNVFIEPVDNLKFALSGQSETLPAGAVTSSGGVLTEQNSLNIANAGVMYMGGSSKFEFASEFYSVNTKAPMAGTKNFDAFFAYAGYKIKSVTPYFMYNKLNYQNGQTYFMKNNFTGAIAGVRYNFSPLAVVKLEAQFFQSDQFKRLNRIDVQWAIGF